MHRQIARQQAFSQAQRACSGVPPPVARPSVKCNITEARVDASSSRRDVLGFIAAAAVAAARPAQAMSLPDAPEGIKVLCDAECVSALESKELVTLPSGLQYKDLVEGKGPNPPVGFQVVVNYVAMTPNGRVFDSSVDKGKPYDIRVGGGQVIPGLDEGLLTMRPGGVRRLYIPGPLAFPKGLKAAAGRPSVPPSSPVMFDVQLLYIPGLEDDE